MIQQSFTKKGSMYRHLISIVVVATMTGGSLRAGTVGTLKFPAADAVERIGAQALALKLVSVPLAAPGSSPSEQHATTARLWALRQRSVALEWRWWSPQSDRTIPAIASNVTFDAIESWLRRIFAGEGEEDREDPRATQIVKEALARAYDEVLRFSPLAYRSTPPLDPESVLSVEPGWAWTRAWVDNPFRYALGYQVVLAYDVVLFLDQLSREGRARDDDGRVVAALRDENGKTYPHLVAEYVVHEYFERNNFSHEQAIGLTTRLFEYGVYGAFDQIVEAPLISGARLFTRPGETPRGKALRLFISWRFESDVRELEGRDVHFTILDPVEERLVSLSGRVLGIVRLDDRPPAVKVSLESGEVAIDLDRIVLVRPDYKPPITYAGEVSIAEIEKRLDEGPFGDWVTLSEPQVRALAQVPEPPGTWLAEILDIIQFTRDALAVDLQGSNAPDPEVGWTFFLWGRRLVELLETQKIALLLDGRIQFNPDVTYTPWYDIGMHDMAMTMDAEPGNMKIYLISLGQRIRNALMTYGEITLVNGKRPPERKADEPRGERPGNSLLRKAA